MKRPKRPYDSDETHDFREYMADYLHEQKQTKEPNEEIVLMYWGNYPYQASYSILVHAEDRTPCQCCNQPTYKMRDCSEIGKQFFITTDKEEGI